MSQKKSSFIGGVTILGIAGIVTKVIGMMFRIPLANMIGTDGMGVYTLVYPTYTLLLTVSAAGIPVAISRLVSERVTMERYREARAILRAALLVLTVMGAALTIGMIVLSGPLSNLVNDAETRIGFIAIAPSILLVSVMSALRGYMQGRSHMAPTAISQVLEQVAKVAISLPLASAGMRIGLGEAAAGALLGITIGEAIALGYMAIVYAMKRKTFALDESRDTSTPSPIGKLVKLIIVIAVPITIGSMIVPVSSFIDASMIKTRLEAIGIDPDTARSIYGLYSGHVISLINVPTVLATAVCIGLVPAISRSRTENNLDEMHDTSRLGLRLGSLISFPCAVGVAMLGAPLLNLLYSGLSADTLALGGQLLSISGWTIVLFTLVQASTGVLQGAGYHKIPMYSLFIGVVFKIILNWILISIPAIGILGAPIASIVCYGVSMLINIIYIVKKTGMRFSWGSIVVRPALAALGMGITVFLCSQVLDVMRRSHVLLTVLVAAAVYVVLVFAFGALRREDMDQVPGGAKLEKLLVRLRVWR